MLNLLLPGVHETSVLPVCFHFKFEQVSSCVSHIIHLNHWVPYYRSIAFGPKVQSQQRSIISLSQTRADCDDSCLRVASRMKKIQALYGLVAFSVGYIVVQVLFFSNVLKHGKVRPGVLCVSSDLLHTPCVLFVHCGQPSESKWLTSSNLQPRGKVASLRRRPAARGNGTRPLNS